jgi:hypothetical protein
MRQYGVAFEDSSAEQLLGDLGAGTFQNAAQLEAAVHRAITQPQRRQARSESIAARVREKFTHEVAARRMAQLIMRGTTSKQSAA